MVHVMRRKHTSETRSHHLPHISPLIVTPKTQQHSPIWRYVGGKKLDLGVCEEHRLHAPGAEQAVTVHAAHLAHTLVLEIRVGRGHGSTSRPRRSPNASTATRGFKKKQQKKQQQQRPCAAFLPSQS